MVESEFCFVEYVSARDPERHFGNFSTSAESFKASFLLGDKLF